MVSQADLDRLWKQAFGIPDQTMLVSTDNQYEPIDKNASQSDKRSPSSPLTVDSLKARLSKGFPSGDFELLTVQNTNSMEPWVDAGDVVILSKDISQVRVGDVATYRSPEGYLVLHRIEEEKVIRGVRSFRFKGINNFRSDPFWIPLVSVKHVCVGVCWGGKPSTD